MIEILRTPTSNTTSGKRQTGHSCFSKLFFSSKKIATNKKLFFFEKKDDFCYRLFHFPLFAISQNQNASTKSPYLKVQKNKIIFLFQVYTFWFLRSVEK